jgi:uncharacterized protein with PIN domain
VLGPAANAIETESRRIAITKMILFMGIPPGFDLCAYCNGYIENVKANVLFV